VHERKENGNSKELLEALATEYVACLQDRWREPAEVSAIALRLVVFIEWRSIRHVAENLKAKLSGKGEQTI
jgi:hypothetical protein